MPGACSNTAGWNPVAEGDGRKLWRSRKGHQEAFRNRRRRIGVEDRAKRTAQFVAQFSPDPTGKDGLVMNDPDCVQLLQWALPRLRLRWAGFRKVRRQVCRRLSQRMKELSLLHIREYQSYIESHPSEWAVLDGLCRISISRFYRDKGVFQLLEHTVLPSLAQRVLAGNEQTVRCWSIGCASGEEPYTVAVLWKLGVAPQFPHLAIRILATDVAPQMIERARRGCYAQSSLKDLPKEWLEQAFLPSPEGWCVKEEYREPVAFIQQDVRMTVPTDRFHLILCRNIVFTYFDEELQRETLSKIVARLAPGGALVIGSSETLPGGVPGLEPWSEKSGIYRRCPSFGSGPRPAKQDGQEL